MSHSRAAEFTFIHSSFRTSSTWFWLAFRNVGSVRAYYEVFHEALSQIDAEGIAERRPDNWESHHPASKPYFLEFSPLLKPSGGVAGYSEEMAFQSFFLSSDHLPRDQADYLRSLIKLAAARNEYPVLTCCRSLGRVEMIKEAIGGNHIFLYRNLFRQWMSYLGQFDRKNGYYLRSILQSAKSHDFFSEPILELDSRKDAARWDFEGLGSLRTAFMMFARLHIYLYLTAYRVCDLTVESDRLAEDKGYAKSIEDAIKQNASVDVSLGDGHVQVDTSGDMDYLPRDYKAILHLQLADAKRALGISDDSAEGVFGQKLVDDCIRVAETYAECTASMQKRLRVVLRERNADAAALSEAQGRAADAEKSLSTVLESTSWRITRPLRDCASYARRLRSLSSKFR